MIRVFDKEIADELETARVLLSANPNLEHKLVAPLWCSVRDEIVRETKWLSATFLREACRLIGENYPEATAFRYSGLLSGRVLLHQGTWFLTQTEKAKITTRGPELVVENGKEFLLVPAAELVLSSEWWNLGL